LAASRERSRPVDLHDSLISLPIAFDHSYATDIDEDGAIVGYAEIAFRNYAVKWEPVAEPASLGLAATAIALVRLRTRKRDSTVERTGKVAVGRYLCATSRESLSRASPTATKQQ
jgi:hypothetical protein